jgi:hypothetical protein
MRLSVTVGLVVLAVAAAVGLAGWLVDRSVDRVERS